MGRWRLSANFQERLARHAEVLGVPKTFTDPRRQLALGHYLSLFLFGLLNPAVRTMRALCAASQLGRLQREVCGAPVSLGSFSEAQEVIDPALLEAIFGELVTEVSGKETAALPGLPAGPDWRIVDSTLWEALPRMHWALWRRQGTVQSAVRLHLCLHVLDDAPVGASVTTGRGCERKAMREILEEGAGYVGDRYYGEDYQLFSELDAKGCFFVLRLRTEAIIHVDEELPLTDADRKAGVIRSAWAHLGCKARYRSMRVRVLWVQTPKEVIVLVNNQPPKELSAELVAELYRRRWQVELFFRWIKCILGCRHWLAESQRGVATQIYLALIGALLLQLHCGQRPNKRMLELLQLCEMGVATPQELEAGLARELARLEQQAARKKTA
jgi:hypothetical protein